MVERLPGESELQFHKRLVYGKLVDRTLADMDYSELAPLLYGQEYSGDSARKMMYGSLKTLQLLDDTTYDACISGSGAADSVLTEIELKKIELQKERQKFFDQRAALNKILRERSREEELNELIREAVRSGNLPELDFEMPAVHYSERDLLVSLNDIHYGAVVDNYWQKYDSEICRKMFKKYLIRIMHIAEESGAENCIVWCNGDEISGNIHQSIAINNKENVIQQIMGVSELISEFLATLSGHFRTVRFVSVPGNHSRLNPNKELALNSERLDDLVGWYLEARLQGFQNIEICAGERIDPTMYVICIRGKNYVGVHGDFDGSERSVQTLQTMVGEPIYAVLSGHLHHNKIDSVQGIKTVMAGSFLGMDDFCVSKRIYGRPEQLVCVVTDDGIEASYDVAL